MSYVWLDPFILGLTYTVSICLCVGSLKPDTDNLSHLPFEDNEEQTAGMTNYFSSIHSSDCFFVFLRFYAPSPPRSHRQTEQQKKSVSNYFPVCFPCVSLHFTDNIPLIIMI